MHHPVRETRTRLLLDGKVLLRKQVRAFVVVKDGIQQWSQLGLRCQYGYLVRRNGLSSLKALAQRVKDLEQTLVPLPGASLD
jgi:hypothetical protein